MLSLWSSVIYLLFFMCSCSLYAYHDRVSVSILELTPSSLWLWQRRKAAPHAHFTGKTDIPGGGMRGDIVKAADILSSGIHASLCMVVD